MLLELMDDVFKIISTAVKNSEEDIHVDGEAYSILLDESNELSSEEFIEEFINKYTTGKDNVMDLYIYDVLYPGVEMPPTEWYDRASSRAEIVEEFLAIVCEEWLTSVCDMLYSDNEGFDDDCLSNFANYYLDLSNPQIKKAALDKLYHVHANEVIECKNI